MGFLKKTHAPARAAIVATALTFSFGIFIGFLVRAGGGPAVFFPPRNEHPAIGKWDDAPGGISLSVGFPAWAGCPQPPCAYSSLGDGPVNATVPWNSQFGEDAWLYKHLFHEKTNGFYLEMGAMDGIHLSNTLFFERAAGWKGLLIEADPVQYAGLAKNRRDSICVHAAVCGRFQTVHYHSASMVGGIFEFMAEEFKERFHKNLTVDMLPAVPCVPLMFILDKFGIGSIDMWSLDVEGAELEVLQTVDFSRLDVKVLVVELHGYDKERDAKVVALLERAGFDVYKMKKDDSISSLNTVFVHRSAWPRLGGVS